MESNELFDRIKACKDSNNIGGALSTRQILVLTPESDQLDVLSAVWDRDNNCFYLLTEWAAEA